MQAPFKIKESVPLTWRMREDDPYEQMQIGAPNKSRAIGMVLGVVASVVTMGAAAPLLAAPVLATQIAGGVMMAGGVLSGVGAVTGNKKLAKIGGIMSLAGGIGGLAASAANSAGVGGAFASGSGSEAVSKMAGSFMESVNSVTGASGLGIGDVYNAGDAARAVSGADFQKAGTIDVAGVESGGAPNLEDPNPGALTESSSGGAPNLEDPNPGGLLNKASEAQPGQINIAPAEAPVTAQTPAPTQSAAGSQIDPANISNSPTPEWSAQVAKNAPAEAGKDTLFGMNKTELMKTGAGMLEKAAAAAFSPDQQKQQDALIATYGAQAARYNSQTEVEQYKLANAKKQVVMISADDPSMDAKVKDAAAKGHEVAFIPAIGTGGVKVTGNTAIGNAQQVAAQAPVRQGVFNKATA